MADSGLVPDSGGDCRQHSAFGLDPVAIGWPCWPVTPSHTPTGRRLADLLSMSIGPAKSMALLARPLLCGRTSLLFHGLDSAHPFTNLPQPLRQHSISAAGRHVHVRHSFTHSIEVPNKCKPDGYIHGGRSFRKLNNMHFVLPSLHFLRRAEQTLHDKPRSLLRGSKENRAPDIHQNLKYPWLALKIPYVGCNSANMH